MYPSHHMTSHDITSHRLASHSESEQPPSILSFMPSSSIQGSLAYQLSTHFFLFLLFFLSFFPRQTPTPSFPHPFPQTVYACTRIKLPLPVSLMAVVVILCYLYIYSLLSVCLSVRVGGSERQDKIKWL